MSNVATCPPQTILSANYFGVVEQEERRISLSPLRNPVPFVDRSEPESVATRLRPSRAEDGVSQESGSESVEEGEEDANGELWAIFFFFKQTDGPDHF